MTLGILSKNNMEAIAEMKQGLFLIPNSMFIGIKLFGQVYYLFLFALVHL